MGNDLRIPDIEIIVGAAGNDVAVICFYQREDIHQGYEVFAVVASKTALPVVRTLLQDALTAINGNIWVDVGELDAGTLQGLDAPPFHVDGSASE